MPSRRAASFLIAAYAAIHVWWAVAGAPRFGSFGESFLPGGWTPVGIAAASLTAILLYGKVGRRLWSVVVLGRASGAR